MKVKFAILSPIAIVSSLFVGPAFAQSSYPICQSSASDIDGDGWGWENQQTCMVNTSSGGGIPICEHSNSDPDGDGWGWENDASCAVNGSGGNHGDGSDKYNVRQHLIGSWECKKMYVHSLSPGFIAGGGDLPIDPVGPGEWAYNDYPRALSPHESYLTASMRLLNLNIDGTGETTSYWSPENGYGDPYPITWEIRDFRLIVDGYSEGFNIWTETQSEFSLSYNNGVPQFHIYGEYDPATERMTCTKTDA